MAFQLVGSAAISYLTDREITLGGYVAKTTTFTPLEGELEDKSMQAVPVLMYLANEKSTHWLGPSSTEEIAEQVNFVAFYSLHTFVNIFVARDTD